MGFGLCQNTNMDAEPQINERELRGGAAELYDCQDRQVLIEGPAGTGKTGGALEKMDHLCWQYPGCRCLVVRKVRRSLNESVLFTYENHDPELHRGPDHQVGALASHPLGVRLPERLPGGPRGSGQDNVDRVMSTDYDIDLVRGHRGRRSTTGKS
jgi:hypothetical protein